MPVYRWSQDDFDALWEACRRKAMHRLSQTGIRNENERLDHLNQAFVSFLAKKERFDLYPATPETIDWMSNYIARTTFNKFIDAKRRQKRRPEIHPDSTTAPTEDDYSPDEKFDAVALSHGTAVTQELYESGNPAHIYETQCLWEELRENVAQMKPKERVVFELLLEAYTREHVALKLNISIDAVNKRIQRGMKFLRSFMK